MWVRVQLLQIDVWVIKYSAFSVWLLAVAKVCTTVFHLGERRNTSNHYQNRWAVAKLQSAEIDRIVNYHSKYCQSRTVQGAGPKPYTLTYTDESKGSEYNSNAIRSMNKYRIWPRRWQFEEKWWFLSCETLEWITGCQHVLKFNILLMLTEL